MPKIIFKCPYIKSGSTSHKENMVEYIATRNGVQKLELKNKNYPATKKQEQFIAQLLKEFPDSKNLFEYADYTQNKTIENASEFIEITLEHNLDAVAKKENYVDYIANRPRVQKFTDHGLFNGSSEEIILSRVAKEISQHEGNIWIPIISLRREDAANTGFDNAQRWQSFLSSYAQTLAENLKIPFNDFRWYASFHDEGHHPHIHMICYSESGRYGYLNQNGIRNIKSGLVSKIFEVEMKEVYAQQTLKRDELKAESKIVVEKLLSNISNLEFQNTKLEDMILELSQHLKHTNGKRVYGYLPPRIKEMVDNITDEIAKQPSISKAYDLWYELQNKVLHNYSDKDIPKLPLSKQKEFKSIKNHIIYEADKLSKGEITLSEIDDTAVPDKSDAPIPIQDDTADEYNPQPEEEEISISKPFVKWTDEYKQAREFLFGTDEKEPDFENALKLLRAESQNGNMLAVFDLGRMYADGLGVEIDDEQSHSYYKQALDGFVAVENTKPWKYLEYRIGKMYAQGLGVAQNDELAAQWFEKSANQKYKFAEYSLGGLYYHGKGVEQNYEKALELYQRSAKQNFAYADYEVAKMFKDGIGTAVDSKQSAYHFRKAFVGFVSMEKQSHDDKLQYRLGSMLQNGIGTEKDIPKSKEYFEKSAKLGNSFACYSLAKIILAEENPTPAEVETAIDYLQIASDSGNQFAEYSLGKVYLEGKYVQQNINKALELFTSSADKGNEYAQYQLGKAYTTGELIPKNIEKAIQYLTSSANQDNQHAQYQLGKIYIIGEDITKDAEKAINYFTQSAQQGNQYSQYALGKLYLMGADVPKDKETAVKWFTLSAEQGNEYAQFFLDNIDKWKDPSVTIAVSKLMHHIGKIFENNQPPQKSNIGMGIDSKRLKKLREKKMAQGKKVDDHQPQMHSY